VKVVKNKMAAPFKTAEFDLMYGTGISRESCILDLGLENGIVEKSGTWFSYHQEQLGQGRENVKNFLKENTQITGDIEQKIREKVELQSPPSPVALTSEIQNEAFKTLAEGQKVSFDVSEDPKGLQTTNVVKL
jgi:recombination protein RecA